MALLKLPRVSIFELKFAVKQASIKRPRQQSDATPGKTGNAAFPVFIRRREYFTNVKFFVLIPIPVLSSCKQQLQHGFYFRAEQFEFVELKISRSKQLLSLYKIQIV